MINRLFCLLAFFAFSLVACQDKSGANLGPYELGVPFELGIGESSICVCGGAEVTFVQVISDSRCPTEVECFWAGEVTVQVLVENDTILLSNSAEPSFNIDTDTLGNFSYQLLSVSPYPNGEEVIPAAAYAIELVVKAL